MFSPPADLIPADLRHVQPFGEAAHSTAQETEAARRAELFRLVEEHLHPDADAEQRRPFFNTLAHEPFKAARGESLHARAERAHARQHEFLGLAQHALVRAHDRVNAARAESLLDRPQVADAVINDRHASQLLTALL